MNEITRPASGRGKRVAPVRAGRARAVDRASRAVKMLLVDDHPMWRATLKDVLDQAGVGLVVGEASDGPEAIRLATDCEPDVVIMDIMLPTMNGIEATRHLLVDHPKLRVMVLASSDERSQVLAAVRAGASAYLLKTAEPEEVVEAVRRVRNGELVFPGALSDVVLQELRRHSDDSAGPLRVIVAAASTLEREGLIRMLEEAGSDVASGVADLDELIRHAKVHRPDVAVIDDELTADDPTAVVADLQSRLPKVGILVVSSDPEAARAPELLASAAGGVGYCFKGLLSSRRELTDAVDRIARRESIVDPHVVSDLVGKPKQAKALRGLTAREREVLSLMAEGHSNQAIAEKLFVGVKTVEAHVGSIFSKLGLQPADDVHRRVVAVITYLRSLS